MSGSELDQELKQRLEEKFGDLKKSPDPLDTPNNSELPLINERTKTKILQRFNLIPPTTWNPSDDPWYPPFMAAMQIAGEEFATLHANAVYNVLDKCWGK